VKIEWRRELILRFDTPGHRRSGAFLWFVRFRFGACLPLQQPAQRNFSARQYGFPFSC